jgi:single-strand DNA-binding protein
MNLNKIIIVGRVGRDPELKATPSGASVCSFSLATSRVWKDKNDEKQEETEWHNVVFWNKPADIISQYVKKGSLLLVEGRVQTRTYEKDGVKMYRTEVIGETFQLPPRSTSGGSGDDQSGEPTPPRDHAPRKKAVINPKETDDFFPEDEINPEDIPF